MFWLKWHEEGYQPFFRTHIKDYINSTFITSNITTNLHYYKLFFCDCLETSRSPNQKIIPTNFYVQKKFYLQRNKNDRQHSHAQVSHKTKSISVDRQEKILDDWDCHWTSLLFSWECPFSSHPHHITKKRARRGFYLHLRFNQHHVILLVKWGWNVNDFFFSVFICGLVKIIICVVKAGD